MNEQEDHWREHAEAVAAPEVGGAGPLAVLPRVGWGPLLVGLGIVITVFVMFVGTVPVVIADPDLDSDGAAIAMQFVLVLGLIGTAVGVALHQAGDLRSALGQLGFKRLSLRDAGWALLAFVAYFMIAVILSLILSPDQEDIVGDLGAGGDSLLLTILVGALITVGAPLSEEIFFRGFAFAGLNRAMPIVVAAVLSTVVWASLHLGGGNVDVVIQLAVFGLILSALYARTGTIWAPILAHGINNVIAFVVLLAT